MKKSVLLVALAFGISGAYAQDLTSKKGEPILPEAGDWAIAIEATPFLNYAGGFLSGSGANAPVFGWTDSNVMTITGKMFKDEKTAYRAQLRIGFNSNTSTAMVGQAGATPPSFPALPTMVEDEQKSSSNFIGLGAGMEMRRGKTRLQGYYGADALIWFTGSKTTYTYGNALSSTDPDAATISHDFGGNIYNNDPYFTGNSSRMTEMKSGTSLGFGVRGFIGAEYFIFPKISIGGEFGWGIGISSNGTSSETVELFESGAATTGSYTTETSNGSGFSVDTGINNFFSPSNGQSPGQLFLILHF